MCWLNCYCVRGRDTQKTSFAVFEYSTPDEVNRRGNSRTLQLLIDDRRVVPVFEDTVEHLAALGTPKPKVRVGLRYR